jgi:UDP-N-acetylmuramoyl-L-alanyl-D-glutamate--2,6-diaminopimelate ligase
MRLDELAAEVEGARIVGDGSVGPTHLAYDSRKAGPGTLFFCVVGGRVDGHEFAAQVIGAGAVALVVERELEVAVPQVVVADARAAMAPVAARFYGDPTAELRLVGVTGTNGKTTTAFLIREILEGAGVQTGLLGTVKQVVGGAEEAVERTTPEAIDLQRTFRRMLDAGDGACAMEVSSHAMSLHRADAIHFELALFTNLTQDHLDFHTDMEDYFLAKRKLFEGEVGTAIINVDDPYGRRLAEEFDCVTFSAEGVNADYVARDVSFDAAGASFTVNRRPMGRKPTSIGGNRPVGGEEVRVRTGLPGHFNVANALGAFAAAEAMGVEGGTAAAGLAKAARVPGRFEPIDEGQGFSVLVDYAHTPDSLENVLRAARRLTTGRLISVFGAGGDRDRDKRPKMGQAGARLSDLAVVTSDNPRSEDPGAIVAEVAAGTGGGAEVEVEVDRRAAIALALGRAEPGDTVVIAGKGHEQGQEFEGGRKVPFDDREVAREELRKLGSPA